MSNLKEFTTPDKWGGDKRLLFSHTYKSAPTKSAVPIKPTLEDYGVTEKELNEFNKHPETIEAIIDNDSRFEVLTDKYFRKLFVIILVSMILTTVLVYWETLVLGHIVFILIVGSIVSAMISVTFIGLVFLPISLLTSKPSSENLKKFLRAVFEYNQVIEEEKAKEEAREKARIEIVRARQEAERRIIKARSETEKRQRKDFWLSLIGKGIEFENEVARLYSELGYNVTKTKASGDEGIDLIFSKGNEKILVQCKAYDKQLSPSTAREFYGAFRSTSEKGILISIKGVSSQAFEWSKNKNIEFVSLSKLLELQNSIKKE